MSDAGDVSGTEIKKARDAAKLALLEKIAALAKNAGSGQVLALAEAYAYVVDPNVSHGGSVIGKES